MRTAAKYFKLQIAPVPGSPTQYEVNSPSGTQVKVTFQSEMVKDDVEFVRDRSVIWSKEEYDKRCRKLGDALFSAFFEPVKKEYLAYEKSRLEIGERPEILLFLPDPLHWLPWELLRSPRSCGDDEYLTLNGAVFRYVHAPDDRQHVIKTITEVARIPLRLLHASASPGGDYYAILPLEPVENLKVSMFPKTAVKSYWNFEKHMMEAPDGVLFHGHGEYKDGEGKLIFLEDGGKPHKVSVKDLATLTETWKTKLLILSACETASFTAETFQSSMLGLIFRYGYPSFAIAYQNEIAGEAGKCFAETFVSTLGRYSLRTCMEVSRKAVRALDRTGRASETRASRDWWLPLIYACTENPEIVPPIDEQAAPDLPWDVPEEQFESTLKEQIARLLSFKWPRAMSQAHAIQNKDSVHVSLEQR